MSTRSNALLLARRIAAPARKTSLFGTASSRAFAKISAFVVPTTAAAGTRTMSISKTSAAAAVIPESDPKQVKTILFVECGFGADAHGQDSTKAAVRACRNAIEFNQIPSIGDLVPGGKENMKLDVLLAVPDIYQTGLDLDAVRKCFPYGKVNIQIQHGGMVATSGKMIEEMGDKNEDMVVVCVAVTVGY